MKIRVFFKAARADFLPASIVPFFIGLAYALNRGFIISLPKLVFGLVGVAAAHLGANLLNDYYDYKSGADNQTVKISSFFGGSRAIQDGIYTDKEILKFSLFSLAVAFLCAVAIFVISKNFLFIVIMFIVGVLAAEYSAPPLRLAYNKLGELEIFFLFGVVLVMGSFYLFSGTVSLNSFFISLPIAFLITGVIICNEIPDFKSDIKAQKFNLLSVIGFKKGYILYGLVIFFSFFTILLNIIYGILPPYAVFISIVYFLGIKALLNLKDRLSDINKLIQASRLTIMLHFVVGIAFILTLLIS